MAARLPWFGAGGKAAITVRQLLTHTSGLRAWLPLYREPDREARLRRLREEAPQDPPGTAYRYSDLNLIVLQLLLEEVTGRPLDVLLRQRITGPLGLRRTRFAPPASWRAGTAATEDARPPWSALDRGWCGARCTTRTPTRGAASPGTQGCSPAPGTWRCWRARC